jgi:subtilisin family serine protease
MRALLLLIATSLSAAEPYYGVSAVRAPLLWHVTRGAGVKIAIIDTGIDAAHPALAATYRGGYDFVHNDTVPDDEATTDSHGTFVAGVIAQVAPEAEVFMLKIYARDNSFETKNLVRAIDWAIAHDVDVINMSFRMTAQLSDARSAIERAERAGIVVVAAAGNDAGPVDFPAAFDLVIAVGAIDNVLTTAPFSNRGRELDVVAPGVDIYSAAVHGTGLVASLIDGDDTVIGTSIGGTRSGDVSGLLIDCGIGRLDELPLQLSGNIAMVTRDAAISFGSALGNVYRAGASAIVVINDEPRFYYTNANPPGVLPPAVSLASSDVARLTPGHTVRVISALGDYRFSYGTSFASPHVAAVAALLRALAPDATPTQIRNAMYFSARDAGVTGRDDEYGSGIVDAYAAAQLLAPEKLPPPPATPRRRTAAAQ